MSPKCQYTHDDDDDDDDVIMLMCAQKLTNASLMYRKEPETKNIKETRSPAVAEGPRERAVSWNLVKYCTNVRRIALQKGLQTGNDLGEWPSRSFKVTNTGAIR